MKITERHFVQQVKKIVACLTRCKDTRHLLEEIHAIIAEVIYAENFYVVLMNESGALHFPYFVDSVDRFSETALNQLSIEDIRSSLTYFALTSNIDCNFQKAEIERLQRESVVNVVGSIPEQWLCFPLITDAQSLGAFVIQSYRDQNEYNHHAIDLLKAISHVVSSAMEAFSIQEELSYANTSLKAYQEKLEALIEVRTQIIEAKRNKLEQEVSRRTGLQQELERKVAQLQQQIDKNYELQRQLSHQASHDQLTGLANRRELTSVLTRLGAKMKRKNLGCYLLFIDLDGFKSVNDTMGHDAGDAVLVAIGRRLEKMVRGYDLIARIGGDEFVVLLENLDENEVVDRIGGRIIEEIARPIPVNDASLEVGASIGVAYACTEEDIKVLIKRADCAMYQAKEQGKGQMVWDAEIAEK